MVGGIKGDRQPGWERQHVSVKADPLPLASLDIMKYREMAKGGVTYFI